MNGWTNQGICYKFARDNVPQKLRLVFLEITDKSFGNRQRYTDRFSHKVWAKMIGISERTFFAHVHELLELGFIKLNTSNKYIEDGGSEAFSYSPVFPTGYGKLYFKDTSSGSDKPINTIPTYDPNGSI